VFTTPASVPFAWRDGAGGGDHGNQFTGGKVAKSSDELFATSKSSISEQETAKVMGISPAEVKRIRSVARDEEEYRRGDRDAALSGM
jgi:hypothetical protein